MAGLTRRERKAVDPFDPFDRFDRWFDDWTHLWPFRRPFFADWTSDAMIPVDEFHEDGTLVIRAELAGIDPEKDVTVTVSDGMLRINAERREEERTEKRGYLRHELRKGTFYRTLPLPEGVTDEDIEATYRNGILEIRVPMPEAKESEPKRIPVQTA